MQRLRDTLRRIHGKGYKAYKDIAGTYRGDGWLLHIDHVQGDPFAAPSRVRLELTGAGAGVEAAWLSTPERRVAASDYAARCVADALRGGVRRTGGHGRSGEVTIDRPGQEALERTAVVIATDRIDVRLAVGLPAAGRSVLGSAAARLLCDELPAAVAGALRGLDRRRMTERLQLADQQAAIRAWLREQDCVAFVADGAVLPRESGAGNRPLRGAEVVPFRAPDELAVRIELPHRQDPLRGMAIRRGVTLIVGGGYHGKSTLLQAIERGVYNHVPGDGREYVITDETAVKIRAEDGRRVECVDISPFIGQLPLGKDTRRFRSEDASGSTSQAAGIVEALEVGARTLLIDEDTSATNFMIRDARMQALVAKDKEPITPFVDKVRQLYADQGVSTILVLGGSGDYFGVADTVLMLDAYRARDVTLEARRIAETMDSGRAAEGGDRFAAPTPRAIDPASFDASRGRREKVDARGRASVRYGEAEIDLSLVAQLVDPSQTRAIAEMMRYAAQRLADGRRTLAGLCELLEAQVAAHGLDAISPHYGKHPGDLARPRRYELAAAINRLRTLRVQE
ncbi:ABC-ATPase domain-containing protein [Paenibacillus sp. IB182496]|uniref:ABC-ATPase domain-containing protein n=1 Tax=Paenibacillus sabuli TaxID=2772509 RepID=A0A927BSP4_9BACL|nr:ABC-ATPase domain-containing protein [Paenibacillus sabuli]MBD2844834.1 ABC-ATPase domain-containing protein [Paenibacillus sabuli]